MSIKIEDGGKHGYITHQSQTNLATIDYIIPKENQALKMESFEKLNIFPVMQGKLFEYLIAKCSASIQRFNNVCR